MSNLQSMYPAVINSVGTSLSGAILANQTKFNVQDITRIPNPPNLLVIGEEYPTAETVKLVSLNGDGSITVERGFQGMAREWDAGTTIARNYTAYDHDTSKANIEALQRANTISKLIYTTKQGIDTFPITPYSIYFITDDSEIRYDTPANERHCIRLLKIFETEKQRVDYIKPIQEYGYLVKESNEIWYYDINGWRIVSMDDLLRPVAKSSDKQVNLELTFDEVLSDERERTLHDMFIAKDTKLFMIDMKTTYRMFKPHIEDSMTLTSDEPYVIYETEPERLAVDVEGLTETIQSYVKETNKFWFWFPTTGKWEYFSHMRMIDYAIKAWAKYLEE